MNHGKQLRVYLVDGTPGGLLTAEIGNWSGHVVAAPRSDIGQLLKRDECTRTGVYILIGDDPTSAFGSAIYIGEGDEIAKRLKKHAKPNVKGGKDFWDRAVLLTSKDSNLTKAHARYLESRLISIAKAAKRARVTNQTEPPPIPLPEADVADMESFLDQVHIVLPVLGVSAFRSRSASSTAAAHTTASSQGDSASPVFEFVIPKHNLKARAQEIDGEFTMLEGSLAKSQWTGTHHPGYENLHAAFLQDGTFAPVDGGRVVLTRDVVFSSPSAAAAVMAGRSANGRTAWVIPATGLTFGEWQSREIPQSDDVQSAALDED